MICGVAAGLVARVRRSATFRLLLAYGALVKIHLVGMLLVACSLGLLLAGGGQVAGALAGWTLLGTGLFAGGACALNHVTDREADARMERTRHRPLPSGRLAPRPALAFGLALAVTGFVILLMLVNLLTAGLGLLAAALYVLVYAPLKKRTWLNTPLGALAGALPALMGWTAVANRLALGGWVLFALVFLWQHVHFHTIAWLHRDEYRAAGYRMLPVLDGDGRRTFRQLVCAAAALLPVSLLIAALGLAGQAYALGATLGGALLLVAGLALARSRTPAAARVTQRLALCYLPWLLGLAAWDVCK